MITTIMSELSRHGMALFCSINNQLQTFIYSNNHIMIKYIPKQKQKYVRGKTLNSLTVTK